MEYEEPEVRDYGRLAELVDVTDSGDGAAVPTEQLGELLASSRLRSRLRG